MRKYINLTATCILYLMFSIPSFSQGFGFSTNKECKDFRDKEKLKVLLASNEVFNIALINAVRDNWKFTKYDTIRESSLENNQKVNLLGFHEGTFTGYKTRGNIKEEIVYTDVDFIGIVNQYKQKSYYNFSGSLAATLSKRHALVFLLFNVNGYTEKNIEPMLCLYIRTLDNVINYVYDNKISMQAYNYVIKKKTISIKEKKLLIRQKELYVDEETIKSTGYTNYEVVDDDKYNEAIINREDVMLFVHIPSIYYCYYVIISAKTGEPYFMESGMDGASFYKDAQKKLFKKIAK